MTRIKHINWCYHTLIYFLGFVCFYLMFFYLLLYPHWVNSLFQGDSLYIKLTFSFIPNTSCLPATYRLTHFVRSNTPFTLNYRNIIIAYS